MDMTESRRRDAAAEAEDAVRGVVEHRAAIEQATGVLMFVYGVDDTAAFALLRGISQRGNVKVNRLAHQLICTVTANRASPLASRRLTELLDTNAG